MRIKRKAGERINDIMERDMALWHYWGFREWEMGDMSGVTRRVTFVKPALIGDVAKYYAQDTIIWKGGGNDERTRLWRSVQPEEDVMTQRFLFLEHHDRPICKIKSFLLGIRGYLEFHSYWPGQKYDARLKDLVPLVDRAMALWESPCEER